MISPRMTYEHGEAPESDPVPSCPRVFIVTSEQQKIAKHEVIRLEDGTWSSGSHVFSRDSMEEGGTACKCGITRAQHQANPQQCTAKPSKKPNRWKPVEMLTRPCGICSTPITYRATASNPRKYCGERCRKIAWTQMNRARRKERRMNTGSDV